MNIITWDYDSDNWADYYEWGQKLEAQFPGQDAQQFAQAINYNNYPEELQDQDLEITELVMYKQGANDNGSWIWTVKFSNGDEWAAEAWCDFTGWDCQSGIDWTRMYED